MFSTINAKVIYGVELELDEDSGVFYHKHQSVPLFELDTVDEYAGYLGLELISLSNLDLPHQYFLGKTVAEVDQYDANRSADLDPVVPTVVYKYANRYDLPIVYKLVLEAH